MKVTGQITEKLRAFVMVNYSNPYSPYSGGGTYVTAEATQKRTDYNLAFTANASWILSPNTFLDFRAGMSNTQWDIFLQPGAEDNYAFYDGYTYYNWGSSGRFDEPVWRNTTQGSIRLTHFQDSFLGGDHEFKAGVEVQTGLDEWTWWRNNPIAWNWYNGNPYYYRAQYGLSGPHPTYGDAPLSIYVCGPASSPNVVNGTELRFGAYIQDSWTLFKRLTLNIGLRYDSYNGFMPESKKAASNGIAPSIGRDLYEGLYGFNPYGAMTIPRWDDVMGWSPLSPRLGLSYDVFGNGKTAFKAAYSSYAEAMPVMYFQTVHPLRPVSYSFYWTDLNQNGVPDESGTDKYVAYGGSPLQMLESYYKQRIQPGIKAPRYNEVIFSLNHELVRDFNVGLQYIWRNKVNTVSAVLYDSATDTYWNTYENAPQWWIPFTTTVPAAGSYPAQTVTMYFMSANAPGPDHGLRQHPRRQARLPGRRADLQQAHVRRLAARRVGRLLLDQGQQLRRLRQRLGILRRLHQSQLVRQPLRPDGLGPSARDQALRHVHPPLEDSSRRSTTPISTARRTSGASRSYPPSAWMAANNALGNSYGVNLEPSGTRRNYSTDNMDFRLEKEFGLGKIGKLGVFIDVFNLLGAQYVTVGMNPGGTWRPTDRQRDGHGGTYTVGSTFGKVTGISGVRNYRISARFSF